MYRSEVLLNFNQQLEKLRNHTLDFDALAHIEAASTAYLLAPISFLGPAFTTPIAQRLLEMGKSVFLVDHTISKDSMYVQAVQL